MLLVTLAAICSGVITIAPCLGIGMAVIAIPALLRTAALARDRQASPFQAPLRGGEKVMMFFESCCLVVIICIMSGLSFLAAFWAVVMCELVIAILTASGPWQDSSQLIAVGIAGIVALVVFTIVFVGMWREFWPSKRLRGMHPDSGQPLDRSPE
jgi:hypothetical protein